VSIEAGVLYVVATPIGNLGDISARAIEVLSGVNTIAAEDTRHTAKLLHHFSIPTPCIALHEHNERKVAANLVARIQGGESLALVSDAGTPLVSDPGYFLVKTVREAGIKVVPVPGPCALTVALSASGMPSDRFVFEGFLTAKREARKRRLNELQAEARTLIFYESKHRITSTLEDMAEIFGQQRHAVVARELTKTFETIRGDSLEGHLALIQQDPNQSKGEFVILVRGADAEAQQTTGVNPDQVLAILMEELSLKQASALAAKICGVKKNLMYDKALQLKRESEDD
jgi:16S rRNA (cytidine1402-2'-O)-methyltransferase